MQAGLSYIDWSLVVLFLLGVWPAVDALAWILHNYYLGPTLQELENFVYDPCAALQWVPRWLCETATLFDFLLGSCPSRFLRWWTQVSSAAWCSWNTWSAACRCYANSQ